jgi:hypothetical protein
VAIDAECRGKDSCGAPRSDLLLTCADLIAASIAVRIRKLGGTDHDVHYLAILISSKETSHRPAWGRPGAGLGQAWAGTQLRRMSNGELVTAAEGRSRSCVAADGSGSAREPPQ